MRKPRKKRQPRTTTGRLGNIDPSQIVYIYTDGACQNAWVGDGSNRGGWSAIIKYNNTERIVSGSDIDTTCNRMEIMPLVIWLPKLLRAGFRYFKVITDSRYVIYGLKGMNRWLRKTKAWPNQDLWRPLYHHITEYQPIIESQWVKGHSGHVQNEVCNKLASKKALAVSWSW